jgi:hypothetical protein
MNSVVITPVTHTGYWRVKMAWPNQTRTFLENSDPERKPKNGLHSIAGSPSDARRLTKSRRKCAAGCATEAVKANPSG